MRKGAHDQFLWLMLVGCRSDLKMKNETVESENSVDMDGDGFTPTLTVMMKIRTSTLTHQRFATKWTMTVMI